MKKKFEDLRDGLEKSISKLVQADANIDRHNEVISLIRTTILTLKPLIQEAINTKEDEIEFFKEVWPFFYGKLFLYIRIYRYQTNKYNLPDDSHADLIKQEELQIAQFFREHEEFCMYYRNRSNVNNEFFTREYSKGWMFDPLSLVIDLENATIASYRAAWCLAYIPYKEFLKKETDKLLFPEIGKKRKFKWKAGKTAAVELIKAQAEAESIEIDGKPATATQLKLDFEERYNEDLKDFDVLLYQTDSKKTEPTPYLTKLSKAFIARKTRLRK